MSKTPTKADTLRTALKAAGYSARQVTVKYDGSTLRVTVRDSAVSLSAVEKIAGSFERVRRCEASGEIFLGGNTYVDVAYHESVVAPVAAAARAVIGTCPEGGTVQVAPGFTACKALGRARSEYVSVTGPGFDEMGETVWGDAYAAERIAVKYLDSRALSAAA